MFMAIEGANVRIEAERDVIYQGEADIVIQQNSPTTVAVTGAGFMYEGEARVRFSSVFQAFVITISL